MTNNTPCHTIASALKWARTILAAQQAEAESKTDSQLLLMHVLGCSACDLITQSNTPLTLAQYEQFKASILKRQTGYPTAYLLGQWDVFELTLSVNEQTLIPRPETEVLIQTALSHLPADKVIHIADLGTGSGAVALNLAHVRSHWQILATDLSSAALAVAQSNAKRHGLSQVNFMLSDWYAALPAEKQFDAIVSNPPYIDPRDPHLKDLSFEPQLALVAEDNGLQAIKTLISGAPNYLKPNGWLMLEHGYQQGDAVHALFMAAGFERVNTVLDLSGHPRVSIGCLRDHLVGRRGHILRI